MVLEWTLLMLPNWKLITVITMIAYSHTWLNSLAPGRLEQNFGSIIFKIILVITGWCVSSKIALSWMSVDLADDKSTVVQVMAWCLEATSHYLSQCWPRLVSLYGITRPQWVKAKSNSSKCGDVLVPNDNIWPCKIKFHSKYYCPILCDTVRCHYHMISFHIETETKWLPLYKWHFSNAFPRIKIIHYWFKFHWNLFPRIELWRDWIISIGKKQDNIQMLINLLWNVFQHLTLDMWGPNYSGST